MYTTNNDVNAKQNFNIQSLIMVIGYFKQLIILHIFVTRKYDRGKCWNGSMCSWSKSKNLKFNINEKLYHFLMDYGIKSLWYLDATRYI